MESNFNFASLLTIAHWPRSHARSLARLWPLETNRIALQPQAGLRTIGKPCRVPDSEPAGARPEGETINDRGVAHASNRNHLAKGDSHECT